MGTSLLAVLLFAFLPAAAQKEAPAGETSLRRMLG